MSNWYWFIRDLNARQVHFCSVNSDLQNLNAYFALCSHRNLLEAARELQQNPMGEHLIYPGDYLSLRASRGWVEAEINFFGDRATMELMVDEFIDIVHDYVAEVEQMYRELGL